MHEQSGLNLQDNISNTLKNSDQLSTKRINLDEEVEHAIIKELSRVSGSVTHKSNKTLSAFRSSKRSDPKLLNERQSTASKITTPMEMRDLTTDEKGRNRNVNARTHAPAQFQTLKKQRSSDSNNLDKRDDVLSKNLQKA